MLPPYLIHGTQQDRLIVNRAGQSVRQDFCPHFPFRCSGTGAGIFLFQVFYVLLIFKGAIGNGPGLLVPIFINNQECG